jgi:hypothetical protein
MTPTDVEAKKQVLINYSVHVDVDATDPEQPKLRVFSSTPDGGANETTTTDLAILAPVCMNFFGKILEKHLPPSQRKPG